MKELYLAVDDAKILRQNSSFEIWREEGQITEDNRDWTKRLLWIVQTGRTD